MNNLINKQPTLLLEAEVELFPLDWIDIDTENNFNNILSILGIKEIQLHPFSFLTVVYHITCCCNHFGMTEEFVCKQIDEGYKMSYSTISDNNEQARREVIALIKEIYHRDKPIHGTFHGRTDETQATPFIPDQTFAQLPPLLKHLSVHFAKGREQDVFLLSSLVVLSAAFPSIRGVYDNKEVASCLFLLICAPASAGKGTMTWARRIGEDCHRFYDAQYNMDMHEYNEAMKNYNKLKESGEQAEIPVKPERKLYFIPANSTSSKLIQTLKANENFGVILETETDTLITALKSQHGDFSDILRKAFHHEPLELLRKTNDEYVSLERSFLSVALSGTPNQIKNLISSVENGFFSRFLFYDFPIGLNWKNVFDHSIETPEGDFKSASVRLQLFAQKINDHAQKHQDGILFKLSTCQEENFNNWFANKQALVNEIYGSQLIASVRRLGLIAFRISMVLSILRYENSELEKQIYCKDEDFNTAMSIIDICLQHSISVYNRLKPITSHQTSKDKKELFYSKLPESFNRNIYLERAALLNIKAKTAEYYISGYINDKILNRIEHNNYKKI